MPTAYGGFYKGTSKSWINTGGDYALTLHNKGNNTGQEGAKGDFYDATYGLPEFIEWRLEWSAGSTPTDGYEVEVYMGESDHATAGTDNPGNLTGVDAVLSDPDQLKFQCTPVGALRLSAARTTSVQKQRFRQYHPQRYQIPLVVNKSGQTSTNTAGNFKLVGTPYYRQLAS